MKYNVHVYNNADQNLRLKLNTVESLDGADGPGRIQYTYTSTKHGDATVITGLSFYQLI